MVKSSPTKSGYIYVLKDSHGLFKIGKAKDITKRRRELQTGNSQQLQLYRFMRVNDMTKAERSLHSIFSAYRRNGEWFDLDLKARALLQHIFDTTHTFEGLELNTLKGFGLR